MIQVIKSGKYKRHFQAECTDCGCVFSFAREDASWNRAVSEHYINCPECDSIVYVGNLDKLDNTVKEK